MSVFRNTLGVLAALAVAAAVGHGGEAPDVAQRLKQLEDENQTLRKDVQGISDERKELRKQVEKLSTDLRALQARLDELDVTHQQAMKTLALVRKDLEARLVEMVQQELQGRRTRLGPPVPAPGRFEDRPYAGFDGQDFEPGVAKALNLKAEAGVLVTQVRDGSPAAVAGLRKDDVIVAVDGVAIKKFQDFRQALGERKGGQVVTLAVARGDEKLEMKMTLGVRRVPVGE